MRSTKWVGRLLAGAIIGCCQFAVADNTEAEPLDVIFAAEVGGDLLPPIVRKPEDNCERSASIPNEHLLTIPNYEEFEFQKLRPVNDILQCAASSDGSRTASGTGGGAGGGSSLAAKSQNPVSDLISLPFQSNTNFGFGPRDNTQHVLNIQPVVPVALSDDWNLINRWILPLVYQPNLGNGVGDEFGSSDLQYTAFLSPRDPGAVIWGIGPAVQAPIASSDLLGTGTWNVGPSAVALITPENWVIGALVQNVWSVEGDNGKRVNSFLMQPFVNYNMPKGWYLVSAPVITANWEAPHEDRWVLPVGGGLGRVFPIGKQPVNVTLQAYANVIRPTFGPDWSVRFQFTFLFPQ